MLLLKQVIGTFIKYLTNNNLILHTNETRISLMLQQIALFTLQQCHGRIQLVFSYTIFTNIHLKNYIFGITIGVYLVCIIDTLNCILWSVRVIIEEVFCIRKFLKKI